jgi:hypothetical protein
MEVSYAKWSRDRKRSQNNMSENEARALHDTRQLYFVVLGNPSAPYAFFEINDEFVYVGYLDNLKREYMNRQFSEVEPGRLFLKEIQVWEYEGESNDKIISTRYRFTPEGKYGIRTVDLRTRDTKTVESESPIDVSGLYLPYPAFGDYERVAQFDPIDVRQFSAG